MIEEEAKISKNNKNFLEHLGDENLHQFEVRFIQKIY
jgi:hypothetical protein